jgi:hypothetical protein
LLRALDAHLKLALQIAAGRPIFSYGQFGMQTSTRAKHRPSSFKYHGFESINITAALGIQHTDTDGVIGPMARRRASWSELPSLQSRDSSNPEPSNERGYRPAAAAVAALPMQQGALS